MDWDGKDLPGRIPTVVNTNQGMRFGEQTRGEDLDQGLVRRTWSGEVNEDRFRA